MRSVVSTLGSSSAMRRRRPTAASGWKCGVILTSMLAAALEVDKDEDDDEEGETADEEKDEDDAEAGADVPASVSSGFVLLRLRVATGFLPVRVVGTLFSRARNSMLLDVLFVDFFFDL